MTTPAPPGACGPGPRQHPDPGPLDQSRRCACRAVAWVAARSMRKEPAGTPHAFLRVVVLDEDGQPLG